MSTGIIEEKGVKIYNLDFSNISNHDQIKKTIQECEKFIRSQPKESLLTLTNVEGMRFNSEIKEKFTAFVQGNKPYVKASAVVGLNGLIQILYNGMVKITGRNLKAFKTKDEAIEYLISKQ